MEIRQEEIAMRRLLQIITTTIIILRNTEEATPPPLIITRVIILDLLTAVVAITQAHSPEVAAVAVILAVPLAVVEEGNS